MKPFIPISFLLTLFLLCSCTKAKDDVSNPVISILSPSRESQHAASDSLHLHILIEDEDLHDFRVTVRSYVNGELCCTSFDIKRHAHDKVVEYERMLDPQVAGRYNISVYAIDHNGNDAAVSHDYQVN
jgi:hypothetical protein